MRAMLLEVIVQSVADARAAHEGGADRLEVVRDIDRDGLTPSADLVRAIAADVPVPLRVMVRETDGFELTGPAELDALRRAIETFAEFGVDGIVAGYVRGGRLDVETLRALLAAAPAIRATLHRAFDAVADQHTAIADARSLPQIDRILTSGGEGSTPTAAAGCVSTRPSRRLTSRFSREAVSTRWRSARWRVMGVSVRPTSDAPPAPTAGARVRSLPTASAGCGTGRPLEGRPLHHDQRHACAPGRGA